MLSRLTEDWNALGIDISREQLRLATENVPGAAHVQADMTALPFATRSVDAVVAYWSLIHVPAEDHRAVLEEFRRVLRPDGRLLVCEGTHEWTGENPDWLDTGVTMQWEIAGSEKTRERLRELGFAVLDAGGVPEELQEEGDDSSSDKPEHDDTTGDDTAADDTAAGDTEKEEDEDEDEDEETDPWTFFEARLDNPGVLKNRFRQPTN